MAGSKRASALARDGRGRRAYNGAIHTRLDDLQRARIIAATFDVATERGASNMTVAHVVGRAGASRRTFYELFNDREDCLLGAFEQALAYASERVLSAYSARTGWREQVRAGLIALLSFLDEEPSIGRLLIVESAGGGTATLARRGEVIALVRSAIERGRTLKGTGDRTKAGAIAPLTGEGIVGGALAVIHSRLVENDGTPLVELTNSLMSMIVLPYLGAGAACRELGRPTPVSAGKRQGALLSSDPFKDTGMRLTYRTVMVLTAIAEHPGASNSTVGNAAEISDQGQISKLLGRLRRLGLVENTGLGPGQGAPNAWSLTDKAQRLVDTIHTHTEHSNSKRRQSR